MAGNAVNLSTPLGLLVAVLGRARLRLGPRGLILAEGYRLPFPVAGAFTVGDVVLTSADFAELARRHPELLDHEEKHSWQYLCCLGLPFLPAYAIGLGWSVLRTGDLAAANVFEVWAGLADGGYRAYPKQPITVGIRRLVGRISASGCRGTPAR